MKIGLILECCDSGPDQHVCERLVNLILPEAELAFTTMSGKRKLLLGCGEAAAIHLEEGCDRVLIVWDLYPAWEEYGKPPCLHQDRAQIFQSLAAARINKDTDPVSLVCIKAELEAWLLADGRALSACFSTKTHPVTINDVRNPERIKKPKNKLSQIIYENRCGTKYQDHIHAKKIAAQIPDCTRLRRCETFKRFEEQVRRGNP